MQTVNPPTSTCSQTTETDLHQKSNPGSPSVYASPSNHHEVLRNPNPSSSSLTPAALRLWKPAAQRNLRNQWSKLFSCKDRWVSASSLGRSHATCLVNAHLSQSYTPFMHLGVLSEIPEIRKKASEKLARQQELYRSKLVSAYKDVVVIVSNMMSASGSMHCFLKGQGTPLVQFCSHQADSNDAGDGGGIPVFLSLSISSFACQASWTLKRYMILNMNVEKLQTNGPKTVCITKKLSPQALELHKEVLENLARELVQMFVLELCLKRLLVLELLSTSCEGAASVQTSRLSWSDEVYPGEFSDLSICELYSEESCEPLRPTINGWESDGCMTGQPKHPPDREVLQVYLTTWLAELNVDMYRVDQIFCMVGEEMHVKLS